MEKHTRMYLMLYGVNSQSKRYKYEIWSILSLIMVANSYNNIMWVVFCYIYIYKLWSGGPTYVSYLKRQKRMCVNYVKEFLLVYNKGGDVTKRIIK